MNSWPERGPRDPPHAALGDGDLGRPHPHRSAGGLPSLAARLFNGSPDTVPINPRRRPPSGAPPPTGTLLDAGADFRLKAKSRTSWEAGEAMPVAKACTQGRYSMENPMPTATSGAAAATWRSPCALSPRRRGRACLPALLQVGQSTLPPAQWGCSGTCSAPPHEPQGPKVLLVMPPGLDPARALAVRAGNFGQALADAARLGPGAQAGVAVDHALGEAGLAGRRTLPLAVLAVLLLQRRVDGNERRLRGSPALPRLHRESPDVERFLDRRGGGGERHPFLEGDGDGHQLRRAHLEDGLDGDLESGHPFARRPRRSAGPSFPATSARTTPRGPPGRPWRLSIHLR